MSNKCYGVIIDHKLFMTGKARERIKIKVKDDRKSLTAAFKAVTKNNKNIFPTDKFMIVFFFPFTLM